MSADRCKLGASWKCALSHAPVGLLVLGTRDFLYNLATPMSEAGGGSAAYRVSADHLWQYLETRLGETDLEFDVAARAHLRYRLEEGVKRVPLPGGRDPVAEVRTSVDRLAAALEARNAKALRTIDVTMIDSIIGFLCPLWPFC